MDSQESKIIMLHTRKIRIPSERYLEQKIAELSLLENPTQEDVDLLVYYKKLLLKKCR